MAWVLGLQERRRLGVLTLDHIPPVMHEPDGGLPTLEDNDDLRRPKLLWVNVALTTALMTSLILSLLPLPVLFAIGFAIAVIINYPCVKAQRQRIAAHAPNALAVTGVIFAAGIFTGILSGTGMVEAMSKSLLVLIPEALGPYMAVITALISLPFTFFISNDAFYYGVLPILAEAAHHYGISAEAIGRASLIGQPFHQLSPLVPSAYLLVGLAGVEFGDHQRFTFKWAIAVCMLMMVAAVRAVGSVGARLGMLSAAASQGSGF